MHFLVLYATSRMPIVGSKALLLLIQNAPRIRLPNRQGGSQAAFCLGGSRRDPRPALNLISRSFQLAPNCGKGGSSSFCSNETSIKARLCEILEIEEYYKVRTCDLHPDFLLHAQRCYTYDQECPVQPLQQPAQNCFKPT